MIINLLSYLAGYIGVLYQIFISFSTYNVLCYNMFSEKVVCANL